MCVTVRRQLAFAYQEFEIHVTEVVRKTLNHNVKAFASVGEQFRILVRTIKEKCIY